MFKNYFKITVRNIRRNVLSSVINVIGLSIGISCVLFIVLYIYDELGYDNFHPKTDRIYRVIVETDKNGVSNLRGSVAAPMAKTLSDEFPEIEKSAILPLYSEEVELVYNEKHFRNNQIWYSDPGVFGMFDFEWLYGSPKMAFNTPNSIVITERFARKLFGTQNPIGKTIRCLNNYFLKTVTISGVIKDIPQNSRFQFDGLLSSEYLYNHPEFKGQLGWGMQNYEVYVLLNKQASPYQLSLKSDGFIKKYMSSQTDVKSIHFQPLKSVRVDLNPLNRLPNDKDNKSIYILILIGASILFIAGINYINLSIARFAEREKEVALRKVTGANYSQIFGQFLYESILFSVLAAFVSAILVYTLLPVFDSISEKELKSIFSENFIVFSAIVFAIAILVGFISGLYPALNIARFNSQQIFNSTNGSVSGNKKYLARKFFVISQYVISIFFLISTITIYRQTLFLKKKNLGYNKEQIVVLPYFPASMDTKLKVFKSEVLRYSTFTNISATSFFPGERNFQRNVWWEGLTEDDKLNQISWMTVDADFIQTLKLELINGNNFSENKSGYILNEKALKKTGWQDPIGKQFDIVRKGSVIGIVKDFHFKSLRSEIEPLALCVFPGEFHHLLLRISPDNMQESLKQLENIWEDFFPEEPFKFTFLDDTFDNVYKSEIRISKVFNLISFLAIFIACIGLFGLANYSTKQRIKEIGIRKVNGAKVSEILTMLNRDFIKWVAIAFVVACPIAYYAMNKWLENFAYKTTLSWWIFALAGVLALGIALLTVSWQSWRAATRNPVEALRYE